MAKLWLTDRAYPLWAYIFRILYWLFAIYLSSLYLQHYSYHDWFKIGLMLLSVFFVIISLLLGRCLDHFFKPG
ncbi:hypothetical protein Ping_3276 [Psychromonas ingrahamii 37]|uniref:Uncharacterized protein n=1 Tax=Psychromonas ingrahamii (strain DSM 17664 / CCUG 51855 / 37) TaxID=357804 RepID=A1SZP8_PSYIN|nr:hypothetical protein [Psychromonas ingrahamii]ABM04963.1 hypothetical protein Ping_3276 [Psychromonas ingrahamii 37]